MEKVKKVADGIRNSKNTFIVTGAGVSTSASIPGNVTIKYFKIIKDHKYNNTKNLKIFFLIKKKIKNTKK